MTIEELLSGRLSGRPLMLVAQALRNPRAAALGTEVLRRELGLDKLATLEDDATSLQLDLTPRAARPPRALGDPLPPPTAPAWVTTADLLTGAYRERRLSPVELIARVLAEIDETTRRQPKLRCVWVRDDERARRAAHESAQRYTQSAPRGPLDGVPFAVKEHIEVAGLPCRSGHDLPSDTLAAPRDATVVARLVAAGAIPVGQTTMTELGLSPIGVNPKRYPLRNPHHMERAAGGSSSGSAVFASLGLAPFAVGSDGGGSVRIPASVCGLFGIKPTFGRVSRARGLLSGSLTHVGPLAASTLDLARFLDAVSGADPEDVATWAAPPAASSFASATQRGVRGLTVGFDPVALRDAQSSVTRVVEQSLTALENCGVRLVEVRLPLAEHAFAIGVITILAELAAQEAPVFARHRTAYGYDVQTLLALARSLPARDYLAAQRLREQLRRELLAVFSHVDALAFPTTHSTALPLTSLEERSGRVDLAGVRAMCRHTFLTNLTGHPAGSAPVGADEEGLPIGLQLVGDAWDEGSVLALMAELERIGVARLARPPYHIELLT